MPIVLPNLLYYWNAKQGHTNQSLANIAPGGAALAITFTGATFDSARGCFTFDGVDDYATLATSGTRMAQAGAFTFEYIYEPINDFTDNDWHEILDGGMYFDHDDSVPGMYVTLFQGTTRIDQTITTAAIQTPKPMHIQWVFDPATSSVKYFVNGVKVHTRTGATGLSVSNGSSVRINGGQQHQEFNLRYYAMRFYDRALTDAEVLQNYNNGQAVGLEEPMVKIGEHRIKNGAATIVLPVYRLTNHPTQPLRIKMPNEIGFIPLVLTNDAAASPIRVQTPSGVRSLKK